MCQVELQLETDPFESLPLGINMGDHAVTEKKSVALALKCEISLSQ